MDYQTTFNRVVEHLLTQNERGRARAWGACSYRTSEGLKCAVGGLLSNETLDKLEKSGYLTVAVLDLPDYALSDLGVDVDDEAAIAFLHELQRIHDDPGIPVSTWPDRLAAFGRNNNLSLPTLLTERLSNNGC